MRERIRCVMKPRNKFVIGASLIGLTVGYLMAAGIKDTGVYFLTPSELATKIAEDPTFYDIGLKMGATVVPGSIVRETATLVSFRVPDGEQEYPVVYKGFPPDTFTDSVEVVVEGRLSREGTFQATTLLAKCGSRYEAVPTA